MDLQITPSTQLSDSSNGSPIKVLLIDDQPIMAEAVRRLLLDHRDIEFHYCPHPRDALERVAHIKPSVILLDLVMPDIGGIEATIMLRSHALTAHVPIVVLSTWDDPKVKSEAFAAGADDYLIKLPDQIELVARIRCHSKSYGNFLRNDELLHGLRESQRKLLESNEALTKLNDAYQLARQESEQAREEAERANNAKSEFLSRMSHELRTPLNAILGFGQLLDLAGLEPEHQGSVQYILQGGRYLLELINEILDIARIEAGRIELSLEPIAVSALINTTLNMVRPQAAQLGIGIQVGNSPQETFVMADRQRLGQVLLNLISNAVKYNSVNGQITIWCETSTSGRLRISVRDTGLGIPPDKLSRLFTAFDRLGAEKTEIEGSGLGLALSKNLAEAMGGTLGVDSKFGLGSTFWLELEAAASPAANSLGVAGPGDSETIDLVGDLQGRTTVLYIEDNSFNFALIEAVLQHRPTIQLLKATCGEEGLSIARQSHPDLILLDLYLPDMNGHEVLRTLQREKGTEDIPVLIISADATSKQRDRLLAAGARMYLTKPLVLKSFLAAIDHSLEERFQDRKMMVVD